MRRRIIFVDDEKHLLDGLRRLLRHRRDVWDMHFALGAELALEQMAEQPFDVVVSDMKMPGMDGARLLAEVRRSYPRTARMILSGHADRMSLISAVGPTQQFLSKPCASEVLVGAIERVLEISDLALDEHLRDLLGGVESLPKPPRIYEEMLAIASDPDCKLVDVVAVIEQDLATSTEVLHLVNSSFFGLASQVDSVARAVTLLGVETIQGLALAGAIFRSGGDPPASLNAARLCRSGVQVGSFAKRIAIGEGWPAGAVNDAFFSGLLGEVGLPILATAVPGAWEQVGADLPTDPWREEELLAASFGSSATRATAYLLGLWGFPEAVVAAIADQPARLDAGGATPAALVVTVARMLAHTPPDPGQEVGSWLSSAGWTRGLDPGGYLTPQRLSGWLAAAGPSAAPSAGAGPDAGRESTQGRDEPIPGQQA